MIRTHARQGAMIRTHARQGAMIRTHARQGAMIRTHARQGAMIRTHARQGGAFWGGIEGGIVHCGDKALTRQNSAFRGRGGSFYPHTRGSIGQKEKRIGENCPLCPRRPCFAWSAQG